ncbi:nicalin [Selaginella moellendorffii]|uniref:nicalin n=1 Tax=Selaginella moellendorffii TaxID=88036 RepID=UPI000D1C38EC|nr:nicalin [Selaginella moellendorffii]|eukprot:XP_024535855.1 nicalin [Selaginella moellendorffii]
MERMQLVCVSGHTLLALLFLVAAYIDLCDAASVFDVYRAIQYDLRGIPMGSRRASLNHHASSGLSVPGSDITRSVVILPIAKVNITLLNEYLQGKRILGGLLLLLPEKGHGDDNKDEDADENLQVERDLENWIIKNNVPYPVYFVYETPSLKALLDEVIANDLAGKPATATTGGFKLVVSGPEPRKIPPPSLVNIQAWLPGLRSEGDSSVVQTIAIVAWYDTFGAAPGIPAGTDSNGSGAVALLEIARLFSRLYANPKTRGRYNLLFGLTAGGPYDYEGTSKWLKSFDQRLRESIDYAICLNSLGSISGEKLWLHVSKPPENAYIRQIHEGLSEVATELGLTVEVKHKKINISSSRVTWEHEQFSRQRITAATLSELETPSELLENAGSIVDTRANITQVILSTKLVAESLARYIYDQQDKHITVFADGSNLAVSRPYVQGWLNLLSRTPRMAPFLSRNSPIIAAFHKELADRIEDVKIQHETMDSSFTFYDSTKFVLSIFQVASVTFDLVVMLAFGSYLGLLFVIALVTTKGLDDLFRKPPSSRKIKGT